MAMMTITIPGRDQHPCNPLAPHSPGIFKFFIQPADFGYNDGDDRMVLVMHDMVP